MSGRPPRAPKGPSSSPSLETSEDSDALVAALASSSARLLHSIPPAVHPASGALDALVLQDVALVAYSCGHACVLARGTDLAALRLLRPEPAPAGALCTAVAMRGTDGAIAAAFGERVVVFEGWSAAARLRGHVFDSKCVVAQANAPFTHVSALSWAADGERLAAVGAGMCVWDLGDESGDGSNSSRSVTAEKVDMDVVASFDAEQLLEGCERVDMGALSPDGLLLAGAACEARLGWVCSLPPRKQRSGSSSSIPSGPASPRMSATRDDGAPVVSTLVGGWAGFSAMQWKPRGGGGPALMTTDADGSLRLWVKVAGFKVAASKSAASWMEEIARCPHAEDTPRAGAAFVHWGGGGGVADDESDSAATAAAHPFMAHGVAPKPSRALHWIVRVAAGDARAWRVRGLDDQPRAEFARLEPGSGQVTSGAGGLLGGSFMAADDLTDDDGHESGYGTSGEDGPGGQTSLADACVAATRALAPIPLTTSSSRRVSLVKSYATSNGERRLRSPEPPEPPATASAFVLLTRDGSAYLARYDLCPTSDAPAVCRARIGSGHCSPVESLAGLPTSFQSGAAADAGHQVTPCLLSQGVNGETLLWRADAASPTREPLVLTARLPGPHLASSFAPPGLVASAPGDACFAVFGVDAIGGALHLYRVPVETRRRDSSSVQKGFIAHKIASCPHGNNTGDAIRILLPIPRRARGHSSTCLVLGFAGNGRACCWHASRPKARGEARFEPVVMRFEGRRFGTVTAADAAVELGTGRHLVAVGSSDGCLRLYEVVEDEASYQATEDEGEGWAAGFSAEADLSGDWEDGDGTVRFRELAFLGERDASEAKVSRVSIMPGGERIGATRDDGSMVVWERASAGDGVWHVSMTQPAVACDELTGTSLSCGTGGLSFAWDVAGELNLFVRRSGDGAVEMYRKPHGQRWERNVILSAATGCAGLPIGPLFHVGLGVLVGGCGSGILAFGTSGGTGWGAVNPSDGGSYSPPRNIFVHLLSGGRAWQTLSALEELSSHVDKSARKALSSSTYAAGRGMAPPAPPLEIMLSNRDAPAVGHSGEPAGFFAEEGAPLGGILEKSTQLGVKRNLFAELMARSEAKFMTEQSRPGVSFDDQEDSNDSNLTKLSKRLRIVSLAGLSRLEQNVLSALAQAASSVESILSSLDSSGARFALISATFLEASPTLSVPSAAMASALHSSAGDALSSHFLPLEGPSSSSRLSFSRGKQENEQSSTSTGSLWFKASRLGAGWWISTEPGAKALVERIARSEFNKTRDADRAALWYVALGRVKPLGALYRAQQNVRMSDFLLRNFRDEKNRVAAGKNAYVLVSKHRIELAAAFFILAGDVYGALSLLRVRLKDEQLAILLARIVDDGAHVEKVLTDIATSEDAQGDLHKLSMIRWLLGHHFDALEAVCEAPLVAAPTGDRGSGSELEAALGASVPPSALALGHLVALTNRPPVRGTNAAVRALTEGRERAMHALTANGSPVAGLRIGMELLAEGGDQVGTRAEQDPNSSATFALALSRPRRLSVLRHVSLTAALALKERAVASSRAVRSGVSRLGLLSLAEQDIRDLSRGSFGKFGAINAACVATNDLGRIDEIHAGLAVAVAAARVASEPDGCKNISYSFSVLEQLRKTCYLACARCVSRSLCALSPLHRPDGSLSELMELRYKMKTAVRMLTSSSTLHEPGTLDPVLDAMRRAVLAVSIAIAYLRGDWSGLLLVLRGCEEPPASLRLPPRLDGEEGGDDSGDEMGRSGDDHQSYRSTASSLAPEAISLEGLRHIASNPAILGISPRLGHRRRNRRAPSLAMVDRDGTSSVAVAEEGSAGASALGSSSTDPLDFIKANPSLNTALGCCAISYLASHQASRAADMVARNSKVESSVPSGKPSSDLISLARLLEASESFEQVAADAIAGWIPLARFGSYSKSDSAIEASAEETAGAFVSLWCALGCLPEYAPCLSEAATVAAAEVASAAASRAASKEGGAAARRRERRRRKNALTTSSSDGALRGGKSQGSDIFDTTSADSLFGAYPVRFSANAKGPWSGRGRHARLYDEGASLFRALCVSASDPPAIVVATPKGIQEVVPSSYTAMPAGFRSHYFSRQAGKSEPDASSGSATGATWDADESVPPSQDPPGDSTLQSVENDVGHIGTSFGEGPYMPLDMSAQAQDRDSSTSSKRSAFSIGAKDSVWRHQVQASALAAHPLRRRFASGGGDGVVRLWDYADPISVGALRGRNCGRVSSLKFSAYGNALVSVHASGQVVLWQEPESAMTLGGNSRKPNKEAIVINAFQHRNASDVVFLDERSSVAAVGDPTAPTAVGHGLRIFDTREPNASIQPSWSARIHNGGEARCLALMEDRVRVVTGGIDGSLSVVDMRMSKSATAGGMQAHVAELPAHDDEVTCLALESPRGRALVSCCRNGDIKLWDSRTLLQLDRIPAAHPPTRHYWSGDGIGGMVGSYGTTAASLTDRSLISCGGDGILKVWGPGYYTSDLRVL